MAAFTIDHPWAFAFGLLGNIISFMVYLAPLTTFRRIYKKKSTEDFQSFPYVVALFSSMLWIYYAFIVPGAYLLITINSFGCLIETVYIAMYLTYAPKKARIYTAKLLLLLNLGVFSLILLLTLLLTKGNNRVHVLGWVCVSFATAVFAAPLSIMRLVIKTKSVEYMPFFLSFFLTISAVAWFFYGFLRKDPYVALPNILGFIFGGLQMVLYAIYRNSKKPEIVEEKLPENNMVEIINKRDTVANSEVHPICIEASHGVDGDHDQNRMDEDGRNHQHGQACRNEHVLVDIMKGPPIVECAH